MKAPYWLVWGSGVPYFRHGTGYSARAEAERLARLNPGIEFVVVQAVASVKRTEIVWEEFGGKVDSMDQPVPF